MFGSCCMNATKLLGESSPESTRRTPSQMSPVSRITNSYDEAISVASKLGLMSLSRNGINTLSGSVSTNIFSFCRASLGSIFTLLHQCEQTDDFVRPSLDVLLPRLAHWPP